MTINSSIVKRLQTFQRHQNEAPTSYPSPKMAVLNPHKLCHEVFVINICSGKVDALMSKEYTAKMFQKLCIIELTMLNLVQISIYHEVSTTFSVAYYQTTVFVKRMVPSSGVVYRWKGHAKVHLHAKFDGSVISPPKSKRRSKLVFDIFKQPVC